MRVKSLLIVSGIEIAMHELPLFRGAVIRLTGGDSVWHNHGDDALQYRYPLIQYKRIGGRAAVFAIGDGVEHLGGLLNAGTSSIWLGDRECNFTVDRLLPGNTFIQTWQHEFHYHLRKWLPLNSENYARYQATGSVAEHAIMLEDILTANMLSMCKGLGITVEKTIECAITHIDEPRKVYYKGTPMMSFDVEFGTNMSLPDYIGLGKGVSLGHGVCVEKKEKKTE